MKQVCLVCDRESPSSNLFCQETYCPAEMAPTILGYGDFLGDIEIVKLVATLRSAALYEARHEKKKVLLKIAHPGTMHKQRIEREAEFLRDLQLAHQLPPTLPTLKPPYTGTSIERDPYGKVMLQDHLLYFLLFEPFEGEPLRDVLLKNPQLWINHVGWLMINLAEAINFLHVIGRVVLSLSPDSVLVRFDKEIPQVPRIQLFDLGIGCELPEVPDRWYEGCAAPAYTAPELLPGRPYSITPHFHSDVYGLGLLLYELLIGRPTFAYQLRSDDIVASIVQSGDRLKMNRLEDVPEIARIARRATEWDPSRRYRTVADFGEALKEHFGDVPPEKKRRWPSRNAIILTLLALVGICVLIVFAISYLR